MRSFQPEAIALLRRIQYSAPWTVLLEAEWGQGEVSGLPSEQMIPALRVCARLPGVSIGDPELVAKPMGRADLR